MNAPALPAYLQNRQSQGVAARATSGMGGVLPPHISIRGNSFTLIDAAGRDQPVGPMLDACVVDISDHMNKRYYENDWTPGSDEPPTCWSSNGIGPSRESAKPQAPTCGQCEWNVRGSDTSRISGKPIKACRDEKFIALLLPAYPTMLFQLVIPPGSFKNWQAFTTPFLKGSTDISDVLVRFGFQPQVNGVMTFQAISYIDEATFGARESALTQKATDALVGRNDVPIAITHQPTQNPGLQASQNSNMTGQAPILATGALGNSTMQQPTAQFGGQQAAQVPFGAGNQTNQPVGNATFGSTATATQHQQPQGSPSFATPAGASPSEPPKTRTRRTREQIAADNAAKAAQGGNPPPGSPAPGQPQAPFPVNQPNGFGGTPANAPFGNAAGAGAATQTNAGFAATVNPAQPPSNPGTFGIQPGADPNVDPQLAEMLRGLGQSG